MSHREVAGDRLKRLWYTARDYKLNDCKVNLVICICEIITLDRACIASIVTVAIDEIECCHEWIECASRRHCGATQCTQI
jgi:hypothetical protein